MDSLPDDPSVSVVICTYNPSMYDHACEAIESILDQTYNQIETVVVVDGSAELFKRIEAVYGDREDVVLTANDTNVGLLESRNRGVNIANGDIVAFIDDDAVADRRWVEKLVLAYAESDSIAVGGKMTPRWVVGKPGFLPEEFYFLVGVTHKGFPDGPGVVRNTFGSNLSFRRDLFLELGGFATQMGGRQGESNLQAGETELCSRLRSTYGKGVWYAPEAQVDHKVFEYRMKFRWIASRAFWQGYSKFAMQIATPVADDTERAFLNRIVTEFIPERLSQLLFRPSLRGGIQLATLLFLTFLTGIGYVYGLIVFSVRDRFHRLFRIIRRK